MYSVFLLIHYYLLAKSLFLILSILIYLFLCLAAHIQITIWSLVPQGHIGVSVILNGCKYYLFFSCTYVCTGTL